MTVGNAAARVHRNLKRSFEFFRAHLRQRCRSTFHQLDAFARLAESGKGVELVKSGATALPQVRTEKFKGPFQIPVNAGGGLIADGHPVGATGVRQVFEAYQQLTDQAGARQIENAKKFLTFNMGGSLTTSVAMVWGRE